MLRTAILFALAVVVSAVGRADDAPAEKTVLKVYPVGDIVAAAAMTPGGGKTTLAHWGSEYSETIKALEELKGIVETMCEERPVAVKAYAPSLSLIVRHSQAGHDEIDRLLKTLAEDSEISIELECRPLFSQSPSKLLNDGHTEAERKQLDSLLSKPQLTQAEAAELLKLIPRAEQSQSVRLRAGRRTPWNDAGRPCTAMGRVNHAAKTVSVRIDNVVDIQNDDETLFASQSFELQEGEAALFHHYCDSGLVVWLVTAKILEPEEPAAQVAQKN